MTNPTSEMRVEASSMALRTINPIRQIVDTLTIPQATDDKPFIPLSIGDPTRFGNLPPPPSVTDAVIEAVKSGAFDGYPPSAGYVSVRQALADHISLTCGDQPGPLANDIVLTSGCSHALDLALAALADPDDIVLIPAPGFSLYGVVLTSYGITAKSYPLLPERSWEIDLEALEDLVVPGRTKAIVVNNPSNPCGSVFSREHMVDIIEFAQRHDLVIVADEIYAGIVFKDVKYYTFASLSVNVPVIQVGGIAKQYVVPGWRLGWVVLHDRNGAFADYHKGLLMLSQRILGPCSLIQAALPAILMDTTASYFEAYNDQLQLNAEYCVDRLSKIFGLVPVAPQGAMYIMTKVDLNAFHDIVDDTDFTQKLMLEEFVMVLPGAAFSMPGYFRIVCCAPLSSLCSAMDRMESFCLRHCLTSGI